MGVLWLDEIWLEMFPRWHGMPEIVRAGAIAMARRLTRIDEIDSLLRSHANEHGAAFLDGIFKDLDFSFSVSDGDRARIPSRGRLIIVANHPLGALDALALVRAVLDVRPDVRVVANNLLMHIENLAGHFLPYTFSARVHRNLVTGIGRALERESALMIFPSGAVSRLTRAGVQDPQWVPGAARLARKYNAPVLPVFIGGRNSWSFYALAPLSPTLAMLLLPRQIFLQRGRTLRLKIGESIPATVFAESPFEPCDEIGRLREHVYRLGENESNPERELFA
jgi:putative hemolysin